MIDIKTKSAITVFFAVVLTFSTSAFAANSKMIPSSLSDKKLNIHTQLPRELKSIPYDNSYKVASVCALGAGVCSNNSVSDGNSSSNNINKRKKCIDDGYTVTASTCNNGWAPIDMCSYHSQYFKTCFDCTTYTLSECPENTKCDTCHNKKLKITGCNTGYKLENGACIYGCGDYTYYSCPTADNAQSCSTCQYDTNKFKIDACKDGFKIENKACVCVPKTPVGYQTTNICTYGVADQKADHCGIMYYKCKTSEELCKEQGFSNADCTSDESISETCNANSNYHKCALDKVKWCTNRNYTNQNCKAYETQGSNCSYLTNYHLCHPTCKSKLAEIGYKEVNDAVFYKGTTAVILKSTSSFNTKNPLGSEYSDIKGEGAFASTISQCSSWSSAAITTPTETSVLDKNLDNIKIIINHAGTSGRVSGFGVGGEKTWNNVTFSDVNAPESTQFSDSREWIYFANNGVRIWISGTIKMTGTNYFGGSTYIVDRWDNNASNNQRPTFYYFEINNGRIIINGGNTTMNCHISFYEAWNDPYVKVTNGATLNMTNTGISIRNNGQFWMDGSSTANIHSMRASGNGSSFGNIFVQQYSKLNLQTWLRLYNAQMQIYGGSTVKTDAWGIEVCNKDRICMGYGTLISNWGNNAVTGPARYYAGPGKGDCDHAPAGNKDWYNKNWSTVLKECGWGSMP